jgi:hypothetical protein
MKAISIITTILMLGFFLVSCSKKELDAPELQAVELTPEMKVKRGEYLVNSMGCDDCHSPKVMTPQGPVPDQKRRLSGHPANEPLAPIADPSVLKDYVLFSMGQTSATGPWGTSFSANLTPDDTGIGNWSEEQFFKAIREGKSKGLDGSRPLLPPMPWFVYKNLSNQDISSIFAYLQSLPPVSNVAPAPVPPTN